jgi:uncharacterized membrane protein (GlpM family)
MEAAFWYNLALSFVVGGAWVTLVTVTADRFGSKVGGLLGGFPATVFVALLFIGITQTRFAAAEATTVVPMAQGVNGLFIIAYLLLVRRGLAWGLAGGLFVWFVLAGILVAVDLRLFWVSVAGWLALLAVCCTIVSKLMKIESTGRQDIQYSFRRVAWRAALGGGVIAFAVLMSKVGGPTVGGIFATFPAMFISTLIITYQTGGAAVSRAVAKALMLSGMINVALYAIAVRYLYVSLGLAAGTILALAFSCGTVYLTNALIMNKVS